MAYMTEIDIARAKAVRANLPSNREIAIMAIIEEVAIATGVPPSIMTGKSKIRAYAEARQLVMFIASREGFTAVDIARTMGHRDHTTVMSGIRAEAIRRQAVDLVTSAREASK